MEDPEATDEEARGGKLESRTRPPPKATDPHMPPPVDEDDPLHRGRGRRGDAISLESLKELSQTHPASGGPGPSAENRQTSGEE